MKLGVGDVVYRNYDGFTHQEGVYGQENTRFLKAVTTFLAGSLNVTSYKKKDMFYYYGAESTGTTPWQSFFGGTIKGWHQLEYRPSQQHICERRIYLQSSFPFAASS